MAVKQNLSRARTYADSNKLLSYQVDRSLKEERKNQQALPFGSYLLCGHRRITRAHAHARTRARGATVAVSVNLVTRVAS